jgi:hypothetical protein
MSGADPRPALRGHESAGELTMSEKVIAQDYAVMPFAGRNFAVDFDDWRPFFSMGGDLPAVPKESDLQDDQKRSRCGASWSRFWALVHHKLAATQRTNFPLNLNFGFFQRS